MDQLDRRASQDRQDLRELPLLRVRLDRRGQLDHAESRAVRETQASQAQQEFKDHRETQDQLDSKGQQERQDQRVSKEQEAFPQTRVRQASEVQRATQDRKDLRV